MSFFKKVFGNNNQNTTEHKRFKEGDIFYTIKDGKPSVYKLLVIDKEFDTFHVLCYNDAEGVPKLSQVNDLGVKIYHFPVASNGFDKPILIANQKVSDEDLIGYFSYIKQTSNAKEIVKYAKHYYDTALQLTNQKNYKEAIFSYEKAIELMPNFFEAIDNRAFCMMDLGRWDEAIAGLNQSLEVNPNSLLATFSIGECYFNSKRYREAKPYFEKASLIDPTHPKPKEFLDSTLRLLNG